MAEKSKIWFFAISVSSKIHRIHKHSNTCHALNFHRNFFFEMLVTMFSIRINNNWNNQNTANYHRTIPLKEALHGCMQEGVLEEALHGCMQEGVSEEALHGCMQEGVFEEALHGCIRKREYLTLIGRRRQPFTVRPDVSCQLQCVLLWLIVVIRTIITKIKIMIIIFYCY